MKNHAFIWFSLGCLFTNAIYLMRDGDVLWGAFFLGLTIGFAFISGYYGSKR